jgi:hypothetical protein
VGPEAPLGAAQLALSVGATLLVAVAGCLVLGERRRQRAVVVRWLLLAIVGGMLGYILYALQVIRPETWGILPAEAWVPWAAMIGVVVAGALLPLAVVMTRPADLQQ